MNILVTGSCGFIGFHLSVKLLSLGNTVVGVDNLNDYYDPSLKRSRLDLLRKYSSANSGSFFFYQNTLEDTEAISSIFENHEPSVVINLAAQAGVRYSIENPFSYASSNIIGFLNILECSKKFKVRHLLYASIVLSTDNINYHLTSHKMLTIL